MEKIIRNWKHILLVFFIFALAFYLRSTHIETTPPGVYPDEAVNGIDAQTANESGIYQWFYPANNGREGLFMNLIAVCFKLFGISVLTLKLPSILSGTLTVLGTYFLARELFNRRVGAISAFLVAVSFWPLNFSRISFRANMLPLVLAWSFYFLWKGIRTKKWFDFAIGGLIFGIGLHTYIAFRIAPLILVVAIISLMLSRQKFLKEYWKSIVIFIIFTAMSAAPMLYTFFISHPEYFESRSASISVLSPEVNQGHLAQTFFRSFGLSLVKYTFWGDQNWRHNFPPYAILDPVTGVAFLFGFIYALIRCFRYVVKLFWRRERNPKMDIYIFLVAWFFIMLVPEFMTAEGNPHALRSIGTLPVTFIFAALTFEYFFRRAQKHTSLFKTLTRTIAIVILLFVGVFNVVKYHFVWANKPEVGQSFSKNLIEISDYIKTLPATQEKFIVAESMQRIPIQLFNWNRPNTFYVYSGQLDQIQPTGKNFVIILSERNDETIDAINQMIPNLSMEEKKDNFGMSYFIMKLQN